jgi:peroxiredoxin Q/BCP
LDALKAKGYVVLGVSVDSPKSHKKFIEKYGLGFTLISDEDHSVVESYGVWVEKSMYGRSYMGTARTTFIIDENGVIQDIISKVDTKNHTSQVITE